MPYHGETRQQRQPASARYSRELHEITSPWTPWIAARHTQACGLRGMRGEESGMRVPRPHPALRQGFTMVQVRGGGGSGLKELPSWILRGLTRSARWRGRQERVRRTAAGIPRFRYQGQEHSQRPIARCAHDALFRDRLVTLLLLVGAAGRCARQQSRGTTAESDATWNKSQAITHSRRPRRKIIVSSILADELPRRNVSDDERRLVLCSTPDASAEIELAAARVRNRCGESSALPIRVNPLTPPGGRLDRSREGVRARGAPGGSASC